ncbi:hypothetical protein CPB85DRAFT_1249362 [Mucidula mucida]|nr:hypothetical protein CPB85DRAFT_1249362 [Mucidula mucida]
MSSASSPRQLRNRMTPAIPAIPAPRLVSRIPVSTTNRPRTTTRGLTTIPEVAESTRTPRSRSNSLDSFEDFSFTDMPTNDPIGGSSRHAFGASTINQTSEKLTDKHFNTYLKQCTSWLAAIHLKADPKKVVPLLAPRLLHQTLETYYNARAKQLDGKTVEEYVDALKARSHGPEHYKHIHENLKKAKQGNLHVNNWYEYVIVAADKLASSKKYALTDRDRIATIRDGLSVRMKNKLLERKDVEDYGDSIADGSNTDAEKWTKYQDKLQEIQELINAQEENKTNDGRSRFSVASTRENFGGMPNPVWSGASLPSYVAPQPGSVHYPAVAAITADAGVRTLEEWFTIRYIVNGCLRCWLPWQNHQGADNKCQEPAPDGEHTLKWCFDWGRKPKWF